MRSLAQIAPLASFLWLGPVSTAMADPSAAEGTESTESTEGQEIHALELGEAVQLKGPAVWMTPGRYLQFRHALRVSTVAFPSCLQTNEALIQDNIKAYGQVIKARDISKKELKADKLLISSQASTIAELRVNRLSDTALIGKLRAERNLARGIIGGAVVTLVATGAIVTTTAVVLD